MDINKFVSEQDVGLSDMMPYYPVFSNEKIIGFGAEKVCYHCKKEFFVSSPSLHKYKIHRSKHSDLWFCRWSCMCAYRREHNDKRRKTGQV